MGVEKIVHEEGQGDAVQKGQTVTIAYTGWERAKGTSENVWEKGSKFDSSVDRNQDFVVPVGVGRLIKGWDEGIVGMKPGEKATLHITHDYAYGPRGIPGVIGEEADLIFDVSLKSFK
ncbi:FKBP-type peptidyl-prolyl cis-trans isomerase [Emericellopsis atlantica]|uniref:peptidylprolyl isomerase n=1 Tax=Emericellopsis atlantica TaxID=2614577 RepID=A0A9P8CPN4_9HYPO|nr:FKBP-type peptidyl-prolyl cis-trans isomerase [Emericellopsis atlantica]KAG9254310.1 FKBP-type peptidyl-prolyl cis-trans isomerase [Emericellopsis atlantica]